VRIKEAPETDRLPRFTRNIRLYGLLLAKDFTAKLLFDFISKTFYFTNTGYFSIGRFISNRFHQNPFGEMNGV